MTFSGDDLKRFKKADVYPYTEPSFKALLARLEKAEALIGVRPEDSDFDKLHEAWRKTCGRTEK